jgi:hypothetical protein
MINVFISYDPGEAMAFSLRVHSIEAGASWRNSI